MPPALGGIVAPRHSNTGVDGATPNDALAKFVRDTIATK